MNYFMLVLQNDIGVSLTGSDMIPLQKLHLDYRTQLYNSF